MRNLYFALNKRCCNQIYTSLSPNRFERYQFRHGTLQLETRSHREIIAPFQAEAFITPDAGVKRARAIKRRKGPNY